MSTSSHPARVRRAFTLIELSAVRKGFTLIELLVVVAIITALIAILLPSLNKAMAISQGAVCASNVKQMNFAFMMYHTDNKFGAYVYPGNGNAAYTHFWMGEIEKYVGSIDDVRLCPSGSEDNGSVWGSATASWNGKYHATGYWIHRNEDGDNDGQSDYWYGSYAMNGWMYNGWSGAESYSRNYRDPGVPIASAPTFVDSAWVDIWPRTYDAAAASLTDPVNGGNWGGGMVRATIDRHMKAVNVSFMDGHVERVELGRLWWLSWSRTFEPGKGEPAI